MAFSKDKLAAKLSSFAKTKNSKTSQEQQEKIKKYIWKPEPGEQVIRIVPLQNSTDFPFVELKFHYDFLGDKVYFLSPSSINKPDPIVELANRLEKTKETWKKGRKLQPKTRTFVPIIVRGKEEEGVKFWGFGVQVYEQLCNDMTEFDDITDFVNGNDIKVIFKTAAEAGKDFPETKITIKPKSRPVIDPENPKAREILELLTKKQPNIFDIYKISTYEELVTALETKLENEEKGLYSAPRGAERTSTDQPQENSNVVVPTESEIEAATSPAIVTEISNSSTTTSPSAQKAKKVASAQDFDAVFGNLFPEKK